MRFLRSNFWIIGIFVLALVVRLALLDAAVGAHGGNLIGTICGSDSYYVISENLIHGHGYSGSATPPYLPNSIRPPFFPFFLAGLYLIFKSYYTPLLVQILIGCLIPILGMFIARSIVASEKVAISVGVFLALEPYTATYAHIFYSETIFTFLFLLSLLCLFQYGEKRKLYIIAASAFFLGLATLTRPVAEYLPIFYVCYVAWIMRHSFKKRLGHVAVFMAVFVLVLSPWLYRNYKVFGVVASSPMLGEALDSALVPSVLAISNHTSFSQEYDKVMATGGVNVSNSTFAKSKNYIGLDISILLAHPAALFITLANTALNFFIHDGIFDSLRHIGLGPKTYLGQPILFLLLSNPLKLFSYVRAVLFTPTILILFGRVAWVLVTIGFFAGAVHFIRRKGTAVQNAIPNTVVSVGIVMYFMLTTLVIGLAVNSRFRVPVNTLILTFAMYGFYILAQRFYSKKIKSL